MFESIRDGVPELAKLQQVVTKLEQETYEAESRVAQLQVEARDAREDDLNREAAALNAGRRPPKPKEPEVRAQLEGAQRRWEVLQRRLALAQGEVARYISENHQELARLLKEAKATKAGQVSELAAPLAKALHDYQLPDADMRGLRPYLEGPQEENTGAPQDSVYFMGALNRSNASGPERVGSMSIGQIEALLTELAGLSARYEAGGVTIVGPSEDEGVA
jgi:hypothetical protein